MLLVKLAPCCPFGQAQSCLKPAATHQVLGSRAGFAGPLGPSVVVEVHEFRGLRFVTVRWASGGGTRSIVPARRRNWVAPCRAGSTSDHFAKASPGMGLLAYARGRTTGMPRVRDLVKRAAALSAATVI